MQRGQAVHRVLHATENVPEQRVLWQSGEDPRGDNPWNKQRLRNEFAMADFFDAAPEGMNESWAKTIFDGCMVASRDGKLFDPTTIPAPPAKAFGV